MLMKNPHPRRSRSLAASFIAAVVVIAVVVVALITGLRAFGNPFTTETADRSAPPVLLELRNMAEFHAAQGTFEVIVDIEDDVNWVPSFLAGERVQFVAVGTVDAIVDFSTLNSGSVTVDDTTSTVTVTLGRVVLQDPTIDHEQSHVMNRDRGLANRVGGVFSDNPTSEASLYRVASDKIAAAAAATELVERAQQNTTATLTALIRSLGYEHVVVRYQVWSAAA